ncbi:SDR family oxidoreductase [Enterocloster sp. OA13]|uniref:SDR family oxidoreductase n=1 Tax=Enterocloster TaxID=2719313 RepID=UPI000470860E|nr:SDR family oxidoreductase [Lachnoclostridium pacaense]MCH1948446.1 SDR family oxidoreductase [Enterocloster sp. OA13]RJW44144.1 SDR family oxidoreductase [Clostridiales bacterium TF09-2AC]
MSYNIEDFNLDFFSLKGKNAVVTGGNSGLGQAFALALAKAGANILVASYALDKGETQKMIEDTGVKYEFIQADISKPGIPKQIVENCVNSLGSIDILVNCAGICICKDVLDFGRSEWDPMIAINLTAAFELSHEAARFMIPQKSGKIINICSLFSYLGGLGSPAYAAMKHGLSGLTKAYADELGKYNIQVNGIAPGYYATDITVGTRSNPETNKRVLDHIPAERWGERQDLMGTVVFLASRASEYVNGSMVIVDGGYMVR